MAAHAGNRPDCCTAHLLETAVFVDDLLTRHGIVHWLDWGSLLGAVRDRALIPWDGDVDFSLLLEDWGPIPALTPEIEARGFHLMRLSRKRCKITYSRVNHRGVDLYRHERRGAMAHYRTNDPLKRPEQVAFPASFLESFETVHLYSHPFPAPSPVVEYLINHRYGRSWKVPLRNLKGIPSPDLNRDDPSPAVEELLKRLSDSQGRLLAAKARLRPTHSRFWSRHADPGLPRTPRRDFLEDVLTSIPMDQRDGVVSELAMTVAVVEQATAEADEPGVDLWLRRSGRTAANVAAGLTKETRRAVRRRRTRRRSIRRTVEDVGEPYIDHLEVRGRKRSTVKTYRSMLRVHLGPYFAGKPLVKITSADVERYVAQALATRSVKTARKELGLLHGIFEFAIRRGVPTPNPCKAVDKPGDADIRFLDPAELEALLRAVPDDNLGAVERVLYLTAATTGMRQGELLGLRWMDFDWPARRIRVRRSYVRGEHGTPKSKRSSRAVPLVDRVGGELDRLHRASGYQADEDLVFCDPDTGGPLDGSDVLKRFRAARQRARLRRVRFRDLRHTFGIRMAAQGVPMRTIQEMMGHRDLKTTLIYADHAPGAHEGDWAEQAFAVPESPPGRLDTNLDTNLSEPSPTERNWPRHE